MIGLGSNRLTVCRRGGMSVTQAGRGGMEWLAGYRDPIWASPYSAQATAALKAAFTAAQWQTIRDYGFAHPEIVGYMNAYAPEDAKIAYSLVEGIGSRYTVGNGTGYFDLGIKPYTDAGVRLKADFSVTDTTGRILGNSGSGYYFQCGFDSVNGPLKVQVGAGGTEQFFTLPSNKKVDMVIDGTPAKVTNYDTVWSTNLQRKSPASQMGNLALFSNNTTGTNILKARVELLEVWSPSLNTTIDNPMGNFIPFKRNGQMELLDLVSGNLATRVGTFTELIESPS